DSTVRVRLRKRSGSHVGGDEPDGNIRDRLSGFEKAHRELFSGSQPRGVFLRNELEVHSDRSRPVFVVATRRASHAHEGRGVLDVGLAPPAGALGLPLPAHRLPGSDLVEVFTDLLWL